MNALAEIAALRSDFPLIQDRDDVVYLDNAATTQKPRAVLDAVRAYYETTNANVHRGVHQLSDAATDAFEGARGRVARRINAASPSEIVWTRGTTEAINLVAQACGGSMLRPGDRVLVTELEHHSNIVPWQMACERAGATLVAAAVTSEGTLDVEDFEAHLARGDIRIAAFGHVSNAIGTVHPVTDLVAMARAAGAVTVVDGAQAMAHYAVDVHALDCDFYAFSGHKMYAPTGIGVLYGREALLEAMPPWQGGGEMIEEVRIEATTYAGLPFKFEAGTPNIAGAIGLAAAVDYLEALDTYAVARHEGELLHRATAGLQQIEGVRIVGNAPEKGPLVSFLMEGAHPHDLGTLLDRQGVAVRTGHHCAMPLMERLGIPGTVRASLALYNSVEDVERLVAGVHKARSFL
ncbi:MAG: SufS family cysteine desulfurase [Gammaproteobacteria bacterium]|nr:SufS family cysteine desulfurase [Gammaproteobacteria bacterium]